jgi:hypothetical protein
MFKLIVVFVVGALAATSCGSSSETGAIDSKGAPVREQSRTGARPGFERSVDSSGVPKVVAAGGRPKVDRELRNIMRDLKAADTEHERKAAYARWDKWSEMHPGPKTVAADDTRERVTRSEATAWWPFGPLLADESFAAHKKDEVVFALTPEGGRRGDPRSGPSAVEVYYQRPPTTVENSDYFEIIDGDGITVSVEYFPPGRDVPLDSFENEKAKPVVVRHRPAVLIERRRPETNVDWRVVRWRDKAEGGGVLRWTIGNNPLTYTRHETIDFIERLGEF